MTRSASRLHKASTALTVGSRLLDDGIEVERRYFGTVEHGCNATDDHVLDAVLVERLEDAGDSELGRKSV